MNFRGIPQNGLPVSTNSYVNNKENTNDLMFKRNLDTSLYIRQVAPVPTYFNEQYSTNRRKAEVVSQREHNTDFYQQFQRNGGNSLVDFSQPVNPIGMQEQDYTKYIREETNNNVKYYCPRCKSTDMLIYTDYMECSGCRALLKKPT